MNQVPVRAVLQSFHFPDEGQWHFQSVEPRAGDGAVGLPARPRKGLPASYSPLLIPARDAIGSEAGSAPDRRGANHCKCPESVTDAPEDGMQTTRNLRFDTTD